MLLFYTVGDRAPSECLVLTAPTAARSPNRLEAALRRAALFLVLLLLAACGGNDGGGGGGIVDGGGSGGSSVVLRSMAITPANPTLQARATSNLVATGTYSDGTTRDLSGSASWTSSATQVATVAPGGVVNAVGDGSTTITATHSGVSTSTIVTVKSAQVSVSYLHIFGIAPADAAQPDGPLLQASDGNFYGTTLAGGANRCSDLDHFCGAIFRLTPSGDETVLYSFGATASDGFRPTSQLIQGKDGALYGMTSSGGIYGAGTAFKITLSGVYTVLYSFGASPSDGVVPIGGLVQAGNGDLYGTTASGGTNHCIQIPQSGGNCGTIFKISPNGAVTFVYSFGSSPSDGVTPNGSLLQASDGSFYGTTVNGGANSCSTNGETNNCGTVFKITPTGAVTILHSFGSSQTDGMAPQGPLIQGRDGAFYGTTAAGGGFNCGYWSGCGTVFRMTPAGQTTTLFAFTSRSDGYGPSPFMIQARDGNFYGTTRSGGAVPADLNGTVFKLTPSGLKTILYSFGPLNEKPSGPPAGIIEGTDGAFYGITRYNGQLGAGGARTGSGTVFKLVVQ